MKLRSYECGCEIEHLAGGRPEIVHCPIHEEAENTFRALEELLAVRPRPVRVPGNGFDLTISYTKGDLQKMDNARLVILAAQGDMS